ncbi:very short patch repair endonuclease [Micromonospora sp. KC723]|nr:very short patch repair endonuclease [Micromonospora sp. KC723]
MAAIRSKNTKPEIALRASLRLVGATGYRLHAKLLPGKPDIAFTRWKIAIFVDGAFWHGHPEHFQPETASEYWKMKIANTQRRDRIATESLAAADWTVLRFWDFEVKDDIQRVTNSVLEALKRAGWSPPSVVGDQAL